jgi:hypothetical protein
MGAVDAEWKIDGKTFELQFNVPSGCRSITVVLPPGTKYMSDNKKIIPDKLKDGKAYFSVQHHNKTITVAN